MYCPMKPTMGPPIGVLPRKATVHSAMTRPRICGSALSCSVVLARARNVMLAAPTNTRDTTATGRVGDDGEQGDHDAEHDRDAGQGVDAVVAPARHEQAADDGTHAHGRRHHAVGAGVAVEGVLGHHRQDDLELVGQRADHEHHQQRRAQRRRTPHVAQPLAYLALGPRA